MRLTYRQIEKEDLGLLRNWRNHPDIRGHTREYRLLNMVNQEDWFESMSRDRNNEMYLMSTDAGGYHNIKTPVGVCGLCYIDWVNRNTEASLYIGRENMRQQGLGFRVLKFLEKKAFDEFNLHKLWAEIYSDNLASIHLFKKAGYVEEGCLREQIFKNGKYLDSLFFSLYRENKK